MFLQELCRCAVCPFVLLLFFGPAASLITCACFSLTVTKVGLLTMKEKHHYSYFLQIIFTGLEILPHEFDCNKSIKSKRKKK